MSLLFICIKQKSDFFQERQKYIPINKKKFYNLVFYASITIFFATRIRIHGSWSGWSGQTNDTDPTWSESKTLVKIKVFGSFLSECVPLLIAF